MSGSVGGGGINHIVASVSLYLPRRMDDGTGQGRIRMCVHIYTHTYAPSHLSIHPTPSLPINTSPHHTTPKDAPRGRTGGTSPWPPPRAPTTPCAPPHRPRPPRPPPPPAAPWPPGGSGRAAVVVNGGGVVGRGVEIRGAGGEEEGKGVVEGRDAPFPGLARRRRRGRRPGGRPVRAFVRWMRRRRMMRGAGAGLASHSAAEHACRGQGWRGRTWRQHPWTHVCMGVYMYVSTLWSRGGSSFLGGCSMMSRRERQPGRHTFPCGGGGARTNGTSIDSINHDTTHTTALAAGCCCPLLLAWFADGRCRR